MDYTQAMQQINRLHDQRIITLDEKNSRINELRKREGLEPLNESGHSHDMLPTFQVAKLDLKPGDVLVVKGKWRHEADAKSVLDQFKRTWPDVKVIVIPDWVDLSVLTVPQGPDLRTIASFP